ncbi:MAG TPA: hypothetical protein VE262_23100 [Blastocatellia bacterium]|nr:hypothetical protein [Blastocatellia bacterium]
MHNGHSGIFGPLVILMGAVFFSTPIISNPITPQASPLDPALAHRYFQEAEALCRQDNGKLWGVSLCGPMLFADPSTRRVVANQGDREGNLTREGDVFVGKLPDKLRVANTAVDWAGVRWTMVLWPLPEDKHDRADTMAHELWHRVQDDIGLPTSGPSNNHLDSLEGRVWLRLEWRALQEALKSSGAKRRAHVRDALAFRDYRRSLFPSAASEERALEMHEGLAEYTGARLSGRPRLAQAVADHLKEAEKTDTFVRSFAYASGPAYGVLLDEAGVNWRKGLKPENDFGLLARQWYLVKPPRDIKAEAEKASRNYRGDLLRAAEQEREDGRTKLVAKYRARLVDGPVLVLPLQRMELQFNPDILQPLETFGTVYPTIRISDLWGILTVSGGALINPSFNKIQVPAPADTSGRTLQGEGWTLQLDSGWSVAPGERKGDFTLKKGG